MPQATDMCSPQLQLIVVKIYLHILRHPDLKQSDRAESAQLLSLPGLSAATNHAVFIERMIGAFSLQSISLLLFQPLVAYLVREHWLL